MQEGDVETRRAAPDAAGRKAHAIGAEPLYGLGQIVHPQADVVERGGVHRRLLLGVERLHQVNFNLERAAAERADVLVDVLPFGDEIAGDFEAQHVDPQGLESFLARAADGDLLNAEDLEGALGHGQCSCWVAIGVNNP